MTTGAITILNVCDVNILTQFNNSFLCDYDE